MKKRRGLSTVVGAVFAVIAITTTIAYVTYSMNTLNQYNQSVMQKNQQMLDTGKEKFQITSVTVPNSKFNITVVNTGILPINFTKLWVQNTSTTDWDRSYVPKNGFVAPGGILKNIGQDISNPTISSDKSYSAMLVTSRVTMQQFTVNSAKSAPLNIQFLASPNTVPSGFNTTLLMIVSNNGSSTLTNLTPQTPAPSRTNVATATCTLVQNQASPPSYNTLAPGSTAIFKWDMKVTGNGGQSCMFGAQLQNPYLGNYG